MATEQQASAAAGAQFTVDDFVDVRWSEMPTYSPDGTRITYRANHSGVMQAYVVDASGGEPTRLTQTDGVIYGVRYRPRHDEVHFTADVGGDEQYQQHLVSDAKAEGLVAAERKKGIGFQGLLGIGGRIAVLVEQVACWRLLTS